MNIAGEALETFQKLFKEEKTYGMYSGDKRQLDVDFIFSTIQTISRENHLLNFDKEEFDYIIIDESHRSGANSYLRFIEYFNPKFLLGMTATPERTDGNDIFSLFDHNIAYEIRLNRAMEEGMLSEFHYYGITDLKVNNETIENTKDFKLLSSDERVEKIIEKAKLYGSDNGITRGLVFCSRNEEAKDLSSKFNERGFKTVSLSGNNSEIERAEAISKLESTDNNERIDYIFTVDILNEGIDIPKINQILMIRPTDSAIVFVQQLGRGLRKANGKDYLTIVDFIGNYKNSYLIPIALYGDTSFNKDTLRKLISEGSKMLPGSSTINFDEITKEKIFQSIDSANMRLLSDLKNDYLLLKYRLGRIPMMMDFVNSEARDPYSFVQYNKTSYYHFACRQEKELELELTSEQKELLILFANEINNSKRIEETLMLKELIINGYLSIHEFKEIVFKKYGYNVSPETINSCINNLNFKFVNKERKIIALKNTFIFHDDFLVHLKNEKFKMYLLDNIHFALSKYDKIYSFDRYVNGFLLYEKYGRKDVCRILNWDKNYESTVYGYKIKDGSSPLFVTYKKSDEISSTTKYNDHFINRNEFGWESKSNRTLKSDEIQTLLNSKSTNLKIYLFIQKSNNEASDFYFFGDLNVIEDSVEQGTKNDDKNNKKVPVVHFNFTLKHTVQDSIYQYITDGVNNIESNNRKNDKNIQLKIELPIEVINEVKHTIPLYDFYAAAGSFSELQTEKAYTELEVEEKYALNDNYFACKVVGESMNKRIPNGSICIFKKYDGGSRNGKIVLVENRDVQDPDFNSGFTVKTYSSQKVVSEEGWEHTEIVLKPNSYNESFSDIIIDEVNGNGITVIGEFIAVFN